MPPRKTTDEEARDVGEQAVQNVTEATRRVADAATNVTRQSAASFEQNRQLGWDVAKSITEQVTESVRQGGQRSREVAQSVGEQVIAGLQQSNQLTLNALSAWVEAVSQAAPNTPLVPFADEWRDAALANFEFAGTLLDVQRQFAEGVYATLAPLRSS